MRSEEDIKTRIQKNEDLIASKKHAAAGTVASLLKTRALNENDVLLWVLTGD